MTFFRKNFSLLCAGLLAMVPIWTSPARADDAEIYNLATDVPAGGDVNIIFMLDRSGSMNFCVDSSGNCTSASNRKKARMFALREAMATVLAKLGDTTKVGLFTYGRKTNTSGGINIGGGTMLAPLRALNDTLPDGTTTHRQYLMDWFVDYTQTGQDQYITNNKPKNWVYNFIPTSSSYIFNDPPNCTASTSGNSLCKRSWAQTSSGSFLPGESTLEPNNGTPLETAYAEIASYLFGKQASKWGNTYLARTGNMAKMKSITYTGSSGGTWYSAIDSTLAVTSIPPLALTGSDYTYRQPDYNTQPSCAAPSWHVILVTDGIPEGEDSLRSDFFKEVIPDSVRTCSPDTKWSCSKELAAYLANSSIDKYTYDWTCKSNCEDYTQSNGSTAAPTAPTNMTNCSKPSHKDKTTTTTVQDYRTYNWTWECQSTPKYNYSWGPQGGTCSGPVSTACNSSTVGQTFCRADGFLNLSRHYYTCTSSQTTAWDWVCIDGDCGQGTQPTPSLTCNSARSGVQESTSRSSATTKTVTWQCEVGTQARQYDNGLGVSIKTDAIFLGPDGDDDAINAMTEITSNGGGLFANPKSVDDLAKALIQMVTTATKEPNTIAAPGVAVNQLNRFQHLDELYYSVFQPNAKGIWEGNLKRFVLDSNQVMDSQRIPAVNAGTGFFKESSHSCWGATASASVQPAGCKGYSQNDGKDPELGGMRSMLNANSRNALTTNTSGAIIPLEDLRLDSNASATTVDNSAALLGYSSSCSNSKAQYCNGALSALGADKDARIAKFNENINFAQGVRAIGGTSMLAGDPLHSQPVLVNYGFDGDNGSGDTRQSALDAALADSSKQENYVFFSTNSGTLHAVNSLTGEEKFAFTPRELLPLIPKTDTLPSWTGEESRIYGLDSTWVPWRRDANGDNDVKDAGDWVYLYGGMRMGGSNYYALNVSNIDNPSTLWSIKGPLAGGFETTTDSSNHTVYRPVTVATLPTNAYRWMGQTWSEPVLARIALKDSNGNEEGRTVLVFGGGYDPTNETQPYKVNTTTITPASTFGTDAYGHQLYIVDAKTGDLLFWVSGGSATYGTGTTTTVSENPTLVNTNMRYSITGSPVAVDRDGDGFTDLIYFADLGGQVFRLDLKNKGTNGGTTTTCTSTTSSTCGDMVLRVSRIATLGEAATTGIANQRRFFEAPGVGILQRPNGNPYMGIAIGSGNRSHPAAIGTQDRIYVFEDSTALVQDLGAATSATALTHSDLIDVTSYTYDADNLIDFAGKKGFYINTTSTKGEKVFSTPLIFMGDVYLTTYVPETGAATTTNQCSPGTGSSTLMTFNVFDGRSAKYNANDLLDRSIEGITTTITGDVQILFNADGTSTMLAGTFAQEGGAINTTLRRSRWYEKPRY